MNSEEFYFEDQDGVKIFCQRWDVDEKNGITPKGIVQISHGLGEHSGRYDHVAQTLNKGGYICYADDHRGHGKTIGDVKKFGQLGPRGWNGTVDEMRELTNYIRKNEKHKDLPIFYLGHSWGSYMGQHYIQEWGNEIKGAILSGTNGKQAQLGPLALFGKIISAIKGKNTPAKLLDKLSIQVLNKTFKPVKTPHDWICSVEEVVEKYKNDPYCGLTLPNGFFIELAAGLKRIWSPKNEAKIPKNLPIFMFTGDNDATNNFTKGFKILEERYNKLGITDLTTKIYTGRHEMLNEANKEEVLKDIISWLDKHI